MEDESHGLAQAHRAFVKFLALWTSLMGLFFNVGFLGPRPHGPGPSLVGWAKLTPLFLILFKSLIMFLKWVLQNFTHHIELFS